MVEVDGQGLRATCLIDTEDMYLVASLRELRQVAFQLNPPYTRELRKISSEDEIICEATHPQGTLQETWETPIIESG